MGSLTSRASDVQVAHRSVCLRTLAERGFGLVCFLCFVWGFKFGPEYLGLGEDARIAWVALFQVGTIFVVTLLALFAALRGERTSRIAWGYIAAACGLYLTGNLYYLYAGIVGFVPAFPNFPELAYFVMAAAFAVGMSKYGEVVRKLKRTGVYNFILVYCAISVACLFVLQDDIEHSVLTKFGTISAFLYPALWFCVASFGVMATMLYRQGRKTFPFNLLLAAVIAEACADLIYAKLLINGTYIRGGITQILWISSIALIAWAVVEHLRLDDEASVSDAMPERRSYNNMAMASLPGAAILIFMISGSVSGAFGDDVFYVGFSILLGSAFAAVAGLREHSIIGALHSLRDEAAEGRRRLSSVLESTSDSVIVLDREFRITYFNGSAAKILDMDGGLVLGKNLWDDFGVYHKFPTRLALEKVLKDQEKAEYEGAFGTDGVWLGVHAFPSNDGMSIFFRDISERRRTRMEIEHLAFNDTLTNLANRASFHRKLNTMLQSRLPVGVLILDLDHFKEINDTRGHPVGDTVLREVALRLTACVGSAGTVARLGGDEFAVILGNVGEHEALEMVNRIVVALSSSIPVDDTLLRIGTSIGIAISQPGGDADILVRNADIALYEVKNRGRGGHAFFRKAMETLLIERNDMKQDLAIALENDEFELYYQPLVDFKTGQVRSCEALLRWNHPERGLMPPDSFIPLIEESGLIVPIGAWVMKTACKEAMTWPEHVSVAVNISTKQFYDTTLIETVKEALSDVGLPPHRLEVEITESALLNDSGENLVTLDAIRELGLKIALDDFGTGYSSLGYLPKFKFDKLKIDKSFVQGLNLQGESEAIVRSVVGLGRELGMAITAEGVETEGQYRWLKETCQLAQGHFISRALPRGHIADFLADFKGIDLETAS
jgi:diguanylate cyclase (GGDEF)-like protein/PAS domain S-box-containing protein